MLTLFWQRYRREGISIHELATELSKLPKKDPVDSSLHGIAIRKFTRDITEETDVTVRLFYGLKLTRNRNRRLAD